MSISVDIAKEMQKLFPNECRITRVKLLHEDEVTKYLMKIEEGHKRATKSKLHFCDALREEDTIVIK